MYREGHLRKQSIGAEMLLGRALAVNPCKVDRTGSCSLRCASTLIVEMCRDAANLAQ